MSMTPMRFASLALFGLTVATAAADPKPPKPPPPPPPPPAHEINASVSVTGLDPAVGDAEGGTYLHVVGKGFMTRRGGDAPDGIKIYFGNHQGEIVRIEDDTHFIVEAPGGKAGESVDVLVIWNAHGQTKLAKAFRFVAKDVKP
jgi:hypothetical protein